MPDAFALPDLAALEAAVEGRVLGDPMALAAASQDWGRLVQAPPRAVVRPASTEDVAAVLAFASAREIPVAARGAGHSPLGQSQADGGIVLDMTSLAGVHGADGNTLVVGAGARWQRVLGASLPRGLTPPVLTDYLELTVGGTLSVGGLGGMSHRHGAQTDLVTELEVVTGTGEIRRCSAKEDSELFDAVRAGLGQCGVITRATLRLRLAKQSARRWKLYYDSLPAFLADQRKAVGDGRFDYVEGQLILDESGEAARWRYLLEAASYFSLPHEPDEEALLGDLDFDHDTVEVDDPPYLGFLDRMAESESVLKQVGAWHHPHPWVNVLVPDNEVEAVVAETIAETTGADLGDTGLVLLYPVRSDMLTTPLLRTPESELVWLFAVLRTASPYDLEGIARMTARNADVVERAGIAGGKVYPVNALPLSADDWKDHFGNAWAGFSSAKRTYDPAGVLAPGQHVFG